MPPRPAGQTSQGNPGTSNPPTGQRPGADDNPQSQSGPPPRPEFTNQGSASEMQLAPPSTPSPDAEGKAAGDRTTTSPSQLNQTVKKQLSQPDLEPSGHWLLILVASAGVLGVALGMLIRHLWALRTEDEHSQRSVQAPPSRILAEEAQHSLDRRLVALEQAAAYLPNIYQTVANVEASVNYLGHQLRSQPAAALPPRDNERVLMEVRDRIGDLEGSVRTLGQQMRSQPRELMPPRPVPATPTPTPTPVAEPAQRALVPVSEPAAPSPEERAYADKVVQLANQMLARHLSPAEVPASLRRHVGDAGRGKAGRQQPGAKPPPGRWFSPRAPCRICQASGRRGAASPRHEFLRTPRRRLNDMRSVQSVFDGLFDVQAADGDRLIAPAMVSTDGQIVTVTRRGQLQFAL